MDGGEFVQTSHLPETEHLLLSSSKWQVRVLDLVVQPTARFLPVACPYLPQCGAIGSQTVGDNHFRLTVFAHRSTYKFQDGLLFARLSDETLKNLTLMVHRASEVVPLAVDLHKHIVEIPLPTARLHPYDSALLDLVGEQWTEPVPPEANSLVAYIDAPFMKQILDVPQRQREPDAQHHRQTDDLGARFELLKRGAFCHPQTLVRALPRLKPSSSDRASGSR